MVASNEDNPVVRFSQSADDLVVNGLVVTRFLETEATIPGDDEQGVRATVLDAQLINDSLEISVDVATDDDRLDVRVVIDLHGFSLSRQIPNIL